MIFSIKAQIRQIFKNIRKLNKFLAYLLVCQLISAGLLVAIGQVQAANIPLDSLEEITDFQLDRVTGNIKSAPSCATSKMLANKQILCLNKKTKSVIRYSFEGKKLIQYGGTLSNPKLIAANNNRVAIVDGPDLKVFSISGKRIDSSHSDKSEASLKRASSLKFVGVRLIIASKGKLSLFDTNGNFLALENKPITIRQIRKPDYITSDSLGNFYLASKKSRGVYVFDQNFKQKYILSGVSFNRILGLATDSSNDLYVLARDSKGVASIRVYRGNRQRFKFSINSDIQPDGISAHPGKDVRVSMYDKKSSSFQIYQYQKTPDRPLALKVSGAPTKINLEWQVSSEKYISGYSVFASDSFGKKFSFIEKIRTAPATLKSKKNRYQKIKIRAVSRSGLPGPFSKIIDNNFEPGYQDFLSQNFKSASEQFLKIEKDGNSNPAALEYLIRSLLAIGEYDFALDVTRKLYGFRNSTSLANTLKLKVLIQAGRYSQAKSEIKSLPVAESELSRNLFFCGIVNVKLSQFRAAESCLRKLIARQPNNIQARFLLLQTAKTPKQKKSLSKKVRWLAKYGKQKRDSLVFVELGNFYLNNSKFKSATLYYNKAKKIDNNNLNAILGLIEAALKQKKYSTARSAALKMISAFPKKADGYFQLAEIMVLQKKTGEAVLAYRSALKLKPESSETKLGLAKAYSQLGNNYQSRQTLNSVLETEKYNVDALFQLAKIEVAAGNQRMAAKYLGRALRHTPNHKQAHLLLAQILEKFGYTHQATRHVESLLQLQPRNRNYKRHLADLYFKQARFDEALPIYRQLLKGKRNSVYLNSRIGSIYFQKELYVSARRSLEKVIRLNRKNEQAHLLLAQVYRKAGMYQSAIRSAKSALTVNKNTETRLLLKSLYLEKKQTKNRKNKREVSVKKVKTSPVYITSIKGQKKSNIAKITITNRGKKDIQNLSLKIFIGDYSNAGQVQLIENLKAQSSSKIDVYADLSVTLGSTQEDRNIGVDMELEYVSNNQTRLFEFSKALKIYGRKAIDWQSSESVTDFLYRDYKLIGKLMNGSYENKLGEKQSGIPVYLSESINVLSKIKSFGVKLQPPVGVATHGIRKLERYVQTPIDTLDRKTGSAADLTLLYASGLLARNVGIAWVAAQEPILLIDTETIWTSRASLGFDSTGLVQYKGKAWIPLKLNSMNDGLAAMWNQGAISYKNLEEMSYKIFELNGDSEIQAVSNDTFLDENFRTEMNANYFDWSRAQEIKKISSLKVSEK